MAAPVLAGHLRPLSVMLAALLMWFACPIAGAAAPEGSPVVNATCPVRAGELVSPDIWIDHDGERIGFCCGDCRDTFLADPNAYSARLAALRIPARPALSPPGRQGSDFRHRLSRLLGRLHMVLLHFPLALLIVAALCEVFRQRKAAVPGDTATVCLVIGALAAAAAAGTGWLLAASDPPGAGVSSELFFHRWGGVSVAGLAAIAAILALIARKWQHASAVQAYRASLLGSAVLVAVVGHLGSRMVYGPDYLLKALQSVQTESALPAVAAARPDRIETKGSGPIFDRNPDDDPRQWMLLRRDARLAALTPPPGPPPLGPPDIPEGLSNPIDRIIFAAWTAGVGTAHEAQVCGDEVFVRRVYLDIIGVVPTLAERRRFLGSPALDKRDRLIDELLARADDYAAHWTPFWEDALGSVSTGGTQGGVASHGNYRDWIFRNFRDNTPYDLMVASLIDPAMPGHQPDLMADVNGRATQVAYILNSTDKLTLQSAANVGQVFLGTAMKCASCHNHFENSEWPQARFVGFAGLFAAADLELVRCEKPTGKVVPAAYPFENRGAPTQPPTDVPSRLARAAALITDPADPRFARTIVNRLWKRYIGLGLVEPADDFRDDRPASHPALLDWLADDFMRSGYDLKHTIRLILTSRTYQTRYDPSLEDHFDVARPDQPRWFRSPALRRLTAEQLIDSVRVISTQTLEPGRRVYLDRTSTALTRALGKPASRNEISTSRADDVAVVQSLELLNGEDFNAMIYHTGPLTREALATRTGDSGATHQPEPASIIFAAVLGREPTAAELRLARDFLGDPPAAADLPSTEFVFIDDQTPDNSLLSGSSGMDSWTWDGVPVRPVFSGERSAAIFDTSGPRAQMFVRHAAPMVVGPADTLFAHVYLDPASPPSEILIQWNDGDESRDGGWSHRAYWGEDLIPYGASGTPSRVRIGDLPPAGRWVRLEVPADAVALGGADRLVSGMSFDQAGGAPVFWDRIGVVNTTPDPRQEALGDLLWALFTSPEFQYIR